MKSMYVLRGIATLAVVVGHALGWIYLGQSWWLTSNTQSLAYRSQVFSPTYHILFSIVQLTYFSVPAFLFASGFFLSFVAGDGKDISWKMVRKWISSLFWPLIIWLCILVMAYWLPLALFSKKEVPTLSSTIMDSIRLSYFVPLVAEFYVLSPFIVKLARSHPVILMVVATALHLTTIIFYYLDQLTHLIPLPVETVLLQADFYFFSWAIYFPLGTVIGLRFLKIKPWLQQHIPLLALGSLVFGALSIVEMEIMGKTSNGLDPQKYSLSIVAYSLCMIFLLLAVIDSWFPIKRQLADIGSKSLGVYLAQVSILVTAARTVYHTLPGLMFQPLVFFLILFAAAFGIPILLGNILFHYSKRSLYPYLFG